MGSAGLARDEPVSATRYGCWLGDPEEVGSGGDITEPKDFFAGGGDGEGIKANGEPLGKIKNQKYVAFLKAHGYG